jgi:hypothetical protein
MKKVTSKIVSMALVAVMTLATAFVVTPSVKAEAATKTYNVFVEEGGVEINSFGNSVSSVSSTNSKVVGVKKDAGKAIVTFKKAGKATVTIRVKGYRSSATKKYTFNVKKASSILKPSMQTIGENGTSILFSVKNSSNINFSSVQLAYTFRDNLGNTIEAEDTRIGDVGAKKSGYNTGYVSATKNLDLSQSSVTVSSLSRSKALETGKTIGSSSYFAKYDASRNILTFKNKSVKKYITIKAYVFFYDAAGNILDVTSRSQYLKKGQVQTSTVSSPYHGYDHVKVVTNAYR